ncbi:MAG: TIGR01212 family radical SAM protein, partial [Bacilli bacterium]|nr:TIGR01212 family radical SAM protein [Bacilli bacterium]
MYKYSLDNKRYHTLNYHYFSIFNSKVSKISLNGGFTCPNRDGKVAVGGCIYCSKDASGDYAGNVNDDIKDQFENIKKIIDKKWNTNKYIAYFQAGTNTYADINKLKDLYEKALSIPNVVGLSIATRPDSIEDNVLEYLIEINKRTYLTIELGLQTIHEKTSQLINRGHDLKCFIDCVNKLRKHNINVVVHIINGLPYETKDMMIDTVKFLNTMDIQGIKIHMLHVLKNTELEKMYNKEKFKILSLKEYVSIVCDQLEYLKDNIVIHRITGDPKEEDLIEPLWLTKKFSVLNEIDKEMEIRGTYQGFNKTILNR